MKLWKCDSCGRERETQDRCLIALCMVCLIDMREVTDKNGGLLR